MIDFLKVTARTTKNGVDIYPIFLMKKTIFLKD